MSAMGLGPGDHKIGDIDVTVTEKDARITGTDTLAGAILSLDGCVRNFHQFTDCSLADALEAASTRPAELLKLESKGHLNFGADADFILLDRSLKVRATYIAGEKAFEDWSDIEQIKET